MSENTGDYTGYSASTAGDVNKDGYADMIIGAYAAYSTCRAGKSYVIFGKAGGLSDISLSSLTSTKGFRILGANNGDQSGCAVSGAGDINNDGYTDVIIDARSATTGTGTSYVISVLLLVLYQCYRFQQIVLLLLMELCRGLQ